MLRSTLRHEGHSCGYPRAVGIMKKDTISVCLFGIQFVQKYKCYVKEYHVRIHTMALKVKMRGVLGVIKKDEEIQPDPT